MSDERPSAEIYRIIKEGPGWSVKKLILPEGLSQETANAAFKEIQTFFEEADDLDYNRLVIALYKIFSARMP